MQESYTKERLFAMEIALHNVMTLLIAYNPMLRGQIDAIGIAWDRSLDSLDARFKDQRIES